MSGIERDVEQLITTPESWSLMDGLLLGAVIGATGAALVVISQVVATRRLRRQAGSTGAAARPYELGVARSPL